MRYLYFFSLTFLLFSGQIYAQNSINGQLLRHDNSPITTAATVTLAQMASTETEADATGNFSFSSDNDIDGLLSVQKTANYSTGLDALDLAAMRQHILGQIVLSDLQIIAADVNQNSAITTSDMILLRQIILGTNNNSLLLDDWLFFPTDFTTTTFDSSPVPVSAIGGSETSVQNFYGVKKGDVIISDNFAIDETAAPNFYMEKIGCGNTIEISLRVDAYINLTGVQLGFDWDADKMTFDSMSSTVQNLNISSFNTTNTEIGKLSFIYFDVTAMGETFPDGSELFKMSFTVHEDIDGDILAFDESLITNLSTTVNNTYADATFSDLLLENFSTELVLQNAMTSATNDGSATIQVNGGSFPFTYLWSNGSTTETITGLAPGDYSVTVTDANGCSSTETFTLISELSNTFTISDAPDFYLSQNPVASNQNIIIKTENARSTISEISIFNMIAQTITQQKVINNQLPILSAPSTSGQYIIVLQTEKGAEVLPLIVH